ncbi:MAG: ABC transporter permease [Alloprevotella sp.]|nr:ABC transporter permease [Alloprevotella sp.]
MVSAQGRNNDTGFWNIVRREFRRVIHDPVYGFCLVIAPIFCLVFFTTLMGKGLPTDLPAGVVDLDNTTTTRMVARNLDAFEQTKVVAHYANVTEARRAMQRGEIYAYFYIPKGTTEKVNRQESPTVSFYTNNTFLVAGSLLGKDMRMMAELASGAAGRTVLRAKGATESQMMAFLQPIVIETHPIGNPWINYNVYLSNILIPGILGIFLFMLTVYTIGLEIKWGTGRELMALAEDNIFKAVTAKLLLQTIFFLTVGFLIMVYLYAILHFPCYGGLWRMLIIMALYVLACEGMGLFMLIVLPTLRLGLSFASLWGVISFSICGMSYPVIAMDGWIQGLSLLFPLRHYYLLYVNTALDGYALSNAWPYVMAFVGFILLPVLFVGRLKNIIKNMEYIP